MSIYNEVGTGGVKGRGCGLVASYRFLSGIFQVGGMAYSIDKARRGVLEMVVIKLIRPVQPRPTPSANRVLYQDTFNGLWNDYDLVSFDAAKALIAAYHQKRWDDRSKITAC